MAERDGTRPSDQTIRAGDVLLGKYRVERELGRGGMGVVFAVHHTELDEVFAFKVLLAGAADQEMVDRFIQEARMLARLPSEHVARVLKGAGLHPAVGHAPLVREARERR